MMGDRNDSMDVQSPGIGPKLTGRRPLRLYSEDQFQVIGKACEIEVSDPRYISLRRAVWEAVMTWRPDRRRSRASNVVKELRQARRRLPRTSGVAIQLSPAAKSWLRIAQAELGVESGMVWAPVIAEHDSRLAPLLLALAEAFCSLTVRSERKGRKRARGTEDFDYFIIDLAEAYHAATGIAPRAGNESGSPFTRFLKACLVPFPQHQRSLAALRQRWLSLRESYEPSWAPMSVETVDTLDLASSSPADFSDDSYTSQSVPAVQVAAPRQAKSP